MNILVIGCDQVGAALIRDLERIGHDISVVANSKEQLKRLDAFDDYTFHGTARVAKNIFRRDKVICRVSDPLLLLIYYKAYLLDTICPTVLTVQAVFLVLSK